MTAQSPPYVLQSGSHSAQLFRQAISTLLAATGGVVGSGDYAVTQNGTPNMSVNIAGGAPGSGGGIWVPGSTLAGVQGLYFGYNDATVNLAIAASNPTNPRIDLAIAQVQDAAYAGATNSFSLAILTGTPAASPVAPSVPASSLALASMAIAANATSVTSGNITDRRSQVTLGSPAYATAPWTALSLGSNVTAGSTVVPSCRLQVGGGKVELKGSLQSTGSVVSGSPWATLPSGLRPPVIIQLPTIVNTAPANLVISNTGGISLNTTSGSGVFVSLDSISVPL